jgi:hypothetical protein
MRALSPIALGLTLAATVATASAQTVISRTISEELVETTVTQDGRGTVVTRRIMPGQAAAPVQPYAAQPYAVQPYQAPVVAYEPTPAYAPAVTYAPPAYYAPPAAVAYAPAYAPQVVVAPETVDDVTVRQYVRPAARVVTTRAPIVARTDARPVRRAQRVVLSPAERRVVYRTIVQEQVIAAPAVRDPYWRAPIVAQDDIVAPAVTPAAAVYPVGGVLPAAAPVYGVPETVAVRVPTVRPYRYSYFGGRVYLIEPATGVIVADVTQY